MKNHHLEQFMVDWKAKCPIFKAIVAGLGAPSCLKIGHLAFQVEPVPFASESRWQIQAPHRLNGLPMAAGAKTVRSKIIETLGSQSVFAKKPMSLWVINHFSNNPMVFGK